MTFTGINYLSIFWGIPVLIFFLLYAEGRRRRLTGKIVEPALWSEVIPAMTRTRRGFKSLLITVACAALGLALLGPRWGYTLREFKKEGADLFILVDTSQSMKAQDLKPNRMERAKRELIDLTSILQGDRVGLIPFAGSAYVACPLTTDYEAFRPFIDLLDTDLIPMAGTNIAAALELALKSLKSTPSRSKAVILLTDGEATEGPLTSVVEEASKEQVKIFVIGVGDSGGAPIPSDEGEGFVVHKSGEVVLSRLNELGLKEIALKTGGTYVRSVTGDMDLDEIYLKGIKKVLEARELKSGQKMIPTERFQIPLFAAVVLLIWEGLLGEIKRKV